MVKVKRTHLTEEERLRVIELHGEGLGVREIADQIHHNPSSVSRLLAKYSEIGTIQDLPHPGRPKKVPARAERDIDIHLKKGDLQTSRDVQHYLVEEEGISVSQPCILRNGKERSTLPYKKQKKPLVTREARRRRIKLAREWLKHDEDFWNSVVFTDEKLFYRLPQKKSQWVLLPKHDHRPEQRMAPKALFGGGGVHMWMAITSTAILASAIYEGDLTAKTYIKIIKDKLLKKAHEHFGDQDWFLQQDGDPAHTAHQTIDTLEELGTSRGFSILPWPAHSPDLNLIENVWSEMQDLIATPPACKTTEELKVRIQETIEGLNLPENAWYWKNLFSSMPKRLREVLDREGFPTRH